ncbi:MAG: phosphatidate cytidylyltransferase [Rhodobacteraceae bacterium]|nr:phosphatidate cytidylyltransferase [Paracoccaceae bacterium]
MKTQADFSDLTARTMSAVAMLAIGLGTLWVGGDVFAVLLIIVTGLMGWELSRMHCSNHLVQLAFGLVLAAAILCLLFLPLFWALGSGAIAIGAAVIGHQERLRPVLLGGFAIILACSALEWFREVSGFGWTIWLILCVVATDIGGYFAGKMVGGPKLWVRISPKKTWSGTIGGWIGAAMVGLIAFQTGLGSLIIVPVSVLVSMASQAGDLTESAMKRQAGIKDSSQLIPGHGGLLDRFDGLLGAGLLLSFGLALGLV